ncbi:hypothetical protein [Streptomyces silvisoli]|uniref:Uncharacterized protein n=1 Tax=Streptomyces silvisoli TaxID=3034235 RepID=A0ABT5ZIZ2_9ACTN|nr:hypothetical protein [Streptomyces silvisoli]MDF3289802.1 hypothetical protein [Streptomyces silvisoli]
MRAIGTANVGADRASGNLAEVVEHPPADAELTTEEQVERACADLRAAVEEFHQELADFEGALRR